MSSNASNPPVSPPAAIVVREEQRIGFFADFRRFFVRGLAALLPTLVTLWLLVWVWNFLWQSLGQNIVWGLTRIWDTTGDVGLLPVTKGHPAALDFLWHPDWAMTRLFGVGLSFVLVYIVGVIVGNYIGRAAWRIAEVGVMRVPLIRAIYPAVKQITDFVLSDRSVQIQQSHVVAVQPHAKGIWSIGLITGAGIKALSDSVGTEMVTVFIPSSPTAFTGYVLVVPRSEVIELPLKVEEAMRLLVSGGVLSVGDEKPVIIMPVEP